MKNIRNLFTNIQRERVANTFRIFGVNKTTKEVENILLVKKSVRGIGANTHPLFTNEEILSIMCKNDHLSLTKLIIGE